MIFKNRTLSLLFMVFVMALSMTLSAVANASPSKVKPIKKQHVKVQLNQAQILAQRAQMQAAYQRLIRISEQKEQQKKLQYSKNSPARLIKTSFDSKKSKVSSNTRHKGRYNKRLKVTATAYTSHVGQTDSTPNIAAWGDRLKPGMKVIAVSRDLLKVYGLKHKQKVRIKGLKGEYLVLDKMNKRWRKKIDIYMG
ncbi:MAG: 3D (Asp-Asp-Asp) domain-containing protein, partial [Cocleimonas sp.]